MKTSEQTQSGWPLRLGAIVFAVSFASPFVLVPVVVASNLPVEWKTALSGLFAVGLPELGMFAAIAIMGKPGFEMVTRRLFAPVKRFLSADRVSPMRYRVGLAMFSIPLLYGWLGPYFEPVVGVETGWGWHTFLDVLFLTGFFVLGGEFWHKIRALFTYDTKAS